MEQLNTWPSPRGDSVAMATPPVLALKHECQALMTNGVKEEKPQGEAADGVKMVGADEQNETPR